MRVLSDLLMQGAVIALTSEQDFPSNPKIGQFCFTNGLLYIYATIDTITSWFLLTNRINYYVHSQGITALEWTVVHNLGSDDLVFMIYDHMDEMQLPSGVVFNDVNTITLNFSVATKGKAIIFSASGGVSGGVSGGTVEAGYGIEVVDSVVSIDSGVVATLELDGTLSQHVAWANLDNVPSTFAPTLHASTHMVGGSDQIPHGNLVDIGTNSHAAIDTALTRLSTTSGTNTGDVTLSDLGGVPESRTVNGHALSSDVTVTAVDIGLGNVNDVEQMPLNYLSTATSLGNSDVLVPSQNAVKVYVDSLIGANDAMVYKGILNCSTNPNYPAASTGHVYKVSVSGKIGGASGINVEIGDMILCLQDDTVSGTQAAVGTYWNVIQVNIDGAVIGPVSSVSGRFASFSGITGKLIEDSGYSASSFASPSQTMYIGTTAHAINRTSAPESLSGITGLVPNTTFTLTQNAVASFTSEESGAVVNTLYLKTGRVGIGTDAPSVTLDVLGSAKFDNIGFLGTAPVLNYGIYASKNYTDPVSNTVGLYFRGIPTYTGTESVTEYFQGNVITINPIINSGHTNSGYIRGIGVSNLRNNNGTGIDDSGTLATLTGIAVQYGNYNETIAATPQTSIAYGLAVYPYYATGTVGTMYDIYLGPGSGGGTVTTRYGIYQASTAARNYFAGRVGLDIEDPDEQLHMTGRLHLGQTSAPATTTDKLYNVSGILRWAGQSLATLNSAQTWLAVQTGPFAMQEVDGHTNGTNLTIVQIMNSNIHNVGQGANAVTLNVPSLVSGVNFTLEVGEAQTNHRWRIKVQTGQYIYLLGSDGITITKGVSGGYIGITSPVIGNCLACKSFKDGTSTYGLLVKVISGSWTQE